MQKVKALSIVLIALMGLAFAQPGKMFEKLSLSEQQESQMRDIHLKFEKERTSLKLEMEKHQLELKTILIEDFDLEKIEKITKAQGKLLGEMHYTVYKMDAEVKSILNDEQWEQYMLHRINRGPGGMKGDHQGRMNGGKQGSGPMRAEPGQRKK